MSTDWKALCEELLIDYEQHLYRSVLADRARAALAAEPVVEGPTDEEVEVWADQQGFVRGHADLPFGFWIDYVDVGALVRAALSRWGHQPAPPTEVEQRHPTPVPVAERLPGPEDCDEEGLCWWFSPADPSAGTFGVAACWVLRKHEPEDDFRTHWLSYPSLPLPDQE